MKLKILSLLTMLTLSMAQPANGMQSLRKYFATANRLKQNATSFLMGTAMSFAGWFGGNTVLIKGSNNSVNGLIINGKRIHITSNDQDPVTKTIYKTIDFPADGVLSVKNDTGNVSLISSGRSNTIEVIATVTAANEDEAKNLVPKIWACKPHTVCVETEYLKNVIQGSIAYNIKVPQKMLQKKIETSHGSIELRNGIGDMNTKTSSGDVSIINAQGSIHNTTSSGDTSYETIVGSVVNSTSSGDQKLKNINGNITANSSSGSILAQNIVGQSKVATSSGDIVIENMKGALESSSITGDQKIKDVTGSATVNTRSGDLYLQNIFGKQSVTSSTGDVAISLKEPTQPITVKSNSGDVKLNVTSLQDAYLKLKSRSGCFSSEWAIDRINNRVGFSVNHKLGSGQPVIEIATNTGDIFLKKNNQ